MASLNHVVLAGNLTHDPRLRQTESGRSVCSLGMAINDAFTGSTGEKVERTCFVDVEVWERQAAACSEHLHKGSAVLVQGRLQLDQWTSPAGEPRRKLFVRASRVQFLSPRNGEPSKAAPDEPF
jgi:single-strand DNA-binding protein